MLFPGLVSNDEAELLEELQGIYQANIYLHY